MCVYINTHIYIYIYIHRYICIHIYIFIYVYRYILIFVICMSACTHACMYVRMYVHIEFVLTDRLRIRFSAGSARGARCAARVQRSIGRRPCPLLDAAWPLQDILLRVVVCARTNRPFILASRLIAHTVAILLHGYWAIDNPPSTSLLYAIHLTRLVMTISCNGQDAAVVRRFGVRLTRASVQRRIGRRPLLDPTSHADFGAATHPGVGGGTRRRRATFERC